MQMAKTNDLASGCIERKAGYTQLIEAREERQLARMKSQLAKLDLLVLDELGYVPTSKLVLCPVRVY